MRARSLTLACSLAVVLAACGGDDGGTGGSADTTAGGEAAPAGGAASGTRTPYPLTIENCGRPITFEGPPERVLILNGTSVAEVESFIALELEDHILANSQSYGQSDIDGMIDKIAALPTGGIELNENFEVPKEQVLALEPDLVISTWAGGFSESMGSATREELDQLGINSYVTPVNCAYGAEDPRPEDQAVYDNQTYEASFQLLEQLGLIFDVADRAAAFIDDARARIDAVEPPAGDPVHVLVAYPGMSMMNATGAPMVFAGPLTDSIIEAAGGVNAFDGVPSFAESANINVEALAAADVDVLVIGLFMPGEDAATYAEQLFAQFPQWDAAKNQRYASIAESFYLGPYNAVGIEKIAAVVAEAG
ncbi:MAG: ABC transporter substrate-binding protein [Vicinamibacterales bacterium]